MHPPLPLGGKNPKFKCYRADSRGQVLVKGGPFRALPIGPDVSLLDQADWSPMVPDEKDCTLHLRFGSEPLPPIAVSEEGRQFILSRLRSLTRDHLDAVFRSARIERADADLFREAGRERSKELAQKERYKRTQTEVLKRWVDAFLAKVRQVEQVSCPKL